MTSRIITNGERSVKPGIFRLRDVAARRTLECAIPMGDEMGFFPQPLEVGETDGFTKNDIFGRKAVGDGLTNLLSASTDPLVLAVNGEWGSGKTVFLKMWAGDLRNNGYPVVYFDAFARDYLGDAFTAIAGEVVDLEKKKDRSAFKDKALAVGKVLLRAGLIGAVKAGTAGVLSGTDIAGAVETAAGDAADKLLEKALSSRDEERGTMLAFRQALGNLPALLCPPGTDEQGKEKRPKPLIFIIDELDRCRPTFALEVLERIKHFFSVANVHFVLGVNMAQLENSVRAAYRLGDDGAKTYLQKFVNLTVELDVQPAVNQGNLSVTEKYIWYLSRELLPMADTNADIYNFCMNTLNIAKEKAVTLRALEQIISLAAMVFAYSKNKIYINWQIVTGLCIMKVLDRRLYRKAKLGTLTYAEAKSFFGLQETYKNSDRDIQREFFDKVWRVCLDENAPDDLLAKFQGLTISNAHKTLVYATANNVIDRFLLPRNGNA